MEEGKQVPQQLTTKNPKKVEAGKRLAVHNRRKRKEKKREEQVQAQSKAKSRVNQYYGIGVVTAGGVIGGLGYYIYRVKKGEAKDVSVPVSQQPRPQNNKFEMD